MIKYWFFGGEEGQEPEYSQASQAEFQKLFMLSNGYIPGSGEGLKVVPTDPASLAVMVSKGAGWIEGYGFALTEAERVSIEDADPTNPRIDRIVAQVDAVTGRKIALLAVKGDPAVTPAPPALTRTAQIYEISLAQITVGAGATSITADKIVDERETEYCGRAVGRGVGEVRDDLAAHELKTPADDVHGLLEVLFAEGGRGDNGSFVRFNNGLQVCWNAMSSSALSVGLRLFSWTYPKAFSSAPTILPSLGIKTDHAGRGYAISGRSPGTTSTTIAVAVSTTMEGTATNIFMLAIGWWKEPGT